MHSHSLNNQTPLVDGIWTYGETLWFATNRKRTITTWEVGFTSGAKPMEVETLTAPDDDDKTYGNLRLLPTPCRLALKFMNTILVWDVQNSKHLLHHTNCSFSGMSFSPDGCFFASSTGSTIHLWKESPTGYILYEKLACSTDHSSPLLSPNGKSIVAFGDHTIRLWRTKSLITPPSSTSTRVQSTEGFVLDFSPDGMIAAVTVQNGKTDIVLDLKAGIP